MARLHLDCRNGISGDMTLAALVDAGASAKRVREGIQSLDVGADVEFRRSPGGALRAMVLAPIADDHRHLGDILHLIDHAPIERDAKRLASRIFTRLGEAEAKVHGESLDHVHFHEVGAADSIADIVGAAIALADLGIERATSTRVNLGSGVARCQHGDLPVPAPAVRELLAEVLDRADREPTGFEMTTPTGAAILTTLVDAAGYGREAPPFAPLDTGRGIGTHAFGRERPLLALVGPS